MIYDKTREALLFKGINPATANPTKFSLQVKKLVIDSQEQYSTIRAFSSYISKDITYKSEKDFENYILKMKDEI